MISITAANTETRLEKRYKRLPRMDISPDAILISALYAKSGHRQTYHTQMNDAFLFCILVWVCGKAQKGGRSQYKR